jgi:hypothetical protein
MKRFVTLFMVLVFTFAIGVGILTAAFKSAELPGQAQPVEYDGHLLYDPIDEGYYCLGTPLNCFFGDHSAAQNLTMD